MKNRYLPIACLLLPGAMLFAGEVTSAGDDLVIDTKGGISVSTADGSRTFNIGGRIQWDYNLAEQNDVVDDDAFDIRRARLYAAGTVGDWGYKAQFNIGNGNGGTPEDLYITYSGLPNSWKVTIGHQNEPFGLEQLNSSKDNSMLERGALSEAYAPGRSDGIQFSRASGNSTLALGVFEDSSVAVANPNAFAVTGRVTTALSAGDNGLVHLGLAYRVGGNDVTNTGLEAAYAAGPLHLQGEYVLSDNAGTDLSGYNLQVGWILTGETRPYSKGIFKKVDPSSASGAWEVVARYESGDIELGNTDASAWGVGLNWYANKYTRLGINYTEGEDNTNTDTGSEWRARFQFAF